MSQLQKKQFFILWFVATLVLVACGGSSSASYEPAGLTSESPSTITSDGLAAGRYANTDVSAGIAPALSNSIPAEEAQQNQQTPNDGERLIIQTANLTIVVKDTEATIQAITQMVEANKGWIVSSNVYQYDATAKSGNITVRIPSGGFSSAMEAIKGLAIEVQSESHTGQDVTEEYVDLDSQLANLEATAERVRGFLDSATTVEEALDVNVELSNLEGQIAVIKGRMQYLSQSAAYSTITVNLQPDIASQPIEIGGWRPSGIAKEALESLISSFQGIVGFVIWFVIAWLPILLLLAIPVIIIRRTWRWWQHRKTAV